MKKQRKSNKNWMSIDKLRRLTEQNTHLMIKCYRLENRISKLEKEIKEQNSELTKIVVNQKQCINVDEPISLVEEVVPGGQRVLRFTKENRDISPYVY